MKAVLKDEPNETGRRPRAKEVMVNFAELDIKGKESLGNLVTKYQVDDVRLIEKEQAHWEGARSMVRPRCAAAKLRRTRREPRSVPRRRPCACGHTRRRILHFFIRRFQSL